MRAAVYLRQSDDPKLTGLAVDRQRVGCREVCAARGWTPVEYVDNDVSATRAKVRPEYQRMLADIEAGQVDAVVTWDLDRLHRRPIELEHFIDLADRHRLALATVTGDVDLSTDNGRLFARIKGAVAKAEVERMSARQNAAAVQRAEQGRPWLSRRPFGYTVDGMKLRPTEARRIRRAYSDFLGGQSLTSIARGWNAAGVKTSTGVRWSQPTLHQLLRSPRNAGLRAYRDEIVGPAAWPAIVDESTWRAAHDRLSDPSRRNGGGGAATYLLTGIARCGVCGDGTTVRKGQRPRDGVAFYRCVRAAHLSRTAEHVEDLVVRVVIARLSRPDARDLLVDDKRPDVAALRKEAERLRRKLDSLAVDFTDGSLTASQLRTATTRARAKLADVEQRMAHVDRAPLLADLVTADDIQVVWDRLPLHRRRAVIDLLMTVTLLPGRKGPRFDPSTVEIEWRQS